MFFSPFCLETTATTDKPKKGSSFQRRGARAQSNAEKKWIVVKKNGNDNFSNGVNLHPLGVDDKVLQKRR